MLRPDRRRDDGFTLLEILVVIAILGLLIGLVAPAALRELGGAKVNIAKQSIERLGSVLDLYKLDVGSYPTTEQGLVALSVRPTGAENWNGPYVKGDTVPLDAWNTRTPTATPRSAAAMITISARWDRTVRARTVKSAIRSAIPRSCYASVARQDRHG